LYGMIYGLLAAATDQQRMARALEIVDQLPDINTPEPLPIREAQTLSMELLFQKALERGLEAAILDSSTYRRYLEQRELDG
ncbi:MAG TPA: ATPase, partial [Chromatiaceae bacterium]|nr:ATPase [Chromatiaceae bacterium]